MKLSEVSRDELFQDSLACAGCGSALAVRLALKALGRNAILVVPPGCMSSVSCYYPQVPFRVPMIVMAFAATGAAISGISAGLKRKGKKHVNVVGFAGDGGTADIGIQSLSGAIDMGYDFIYICYDNEAYMNTGVQRSGLTPFGATATTTPRYEDQPKKDLLRIVSAHDIPYAATACVSYPLDYMQKVEKASKVNGPTYLHVLVPCPPGWGIAPDRTIEIGHLAVQTGLWRLEEYQDGVFSTTHRPSRKRPVADYFAAQTRFRNLSPEQVDAIQEDVDRRWESM